LLRGKPPSGPSKPGRSERELPGLPSLPLASGISDFERQNGKPFCNDTDNLPKS
jgi:hypothetical protein